MQTVIILQIVLFLVLLIYSIINVEGEMSSSIFNIGSVFILIYLGLLFIWSRKTMYSSNKAMYIVQFVILSFLIIVPISIFIVLQLGNW